MNIVILILGIMLLVFQSIAYGYLPGVALKKGEQVTVIYDQVQMPILIGVIMYMLSFAVMATSFMS